MKKFLTIFFLIFTFILVWVNKSYAMGDLPITSAVYDNSGTFLILNSFEGDDYNFSSTPKLFVDSQENKAYFDIEASVLTCPARDFVFNNSNIKEVIVNQFSTNPNVVRVVIKYNDGFNPKNIQLKRINNTLIVRFATTQVQNYYFQHSYIDSIDSNNGFFEPIIIQSPVIASQNDMLSQINSAFKLGTTTEDKNYILEKKDLILTSKYFIDDVTLKNGIIYVNGIGAYTISKPIILNNPSRIVYDIPNATLNSTLHNKQFSLTQSDELKIAQFDKTTVRFVISTQDKDKYIPVMFSDGQKFAFSDFNNATIAYNVNKNFLTAINDSPSESNTHIIKLVFSKPVTYSSIRNNKSFDLIFYNTEKAQDINLKSSFIFEGAKISALKNGATKLTLPISEGDIIDVHTGLDSKTIRIKLKSKHINLPKQEKPSIENNPVIPPKIDHGGKIYIVLDPGHGGTDCGATRNGIYEKNITLDIAKRVEKQLTKKGYEVFMTRNSDETVSLQDRVEISENLQPEIFVSIHVNSSNSTTPKGIETHYYKDNSLHLAKVIHASMLNHVNAANRGLFKSKFYVINHTTAPAVLVEIGFLSNDSERTQLVTEGRKQATAKAIVEGIDEYFKK